MPNYSHDQMYIIKMKNQATVLDQFREYLTNSANDANPPAYYNLTATTSTHDRDVFEEMDDDVHYRCALLDYEGNKISCIYWCICYKYVSEDIQSIHCKLKYKTKEESVIENFVYNLHLNLETDFPGDSYLNFEISEPLIEQMRKFETAPFVQEKVALAYEELEEENGLSPLAQKNQYCRRKYNLRSPQQRGEFQRDHDRIIYSKAFRRMVDKAQIFSSAKGDHYRTRMTHTLIVCQIAKSISHQLKLNSSLAEAIAIGHDLGHTPFGHQGERTLHAILTGKEGFEVNFLSLKLDDPIEDESALFPYGGFKHNYQSVRVASCLESQYPEIDGLDLSEQTLNGMWMHTGKKAGLDIQDFSDGFLTEQGDVAFTLEGQVVAVADEIAQRSHDIDDAFASHLITPVELSQYLSLKKSGALKQEIDKLLAKIEDLDSKNRLFSDKSELIYSQISSIIVHHFIRDVCSATDERMAAYDIERFNANNHCIDQKLVWFSDSGADLCKYLENIISKKVINSHEVTMFDQNGSNIVLALFKAYYKNPMLLHKGTLQRIWNEYRQQGFEVISFREGNPQLIKDEWHNITTANIPANEDQRSEEHKVLLKKRIILVRGICDFISGMTDSYAINEYRKIVP